MSEDVFDKVKYSVRKYKDSQYKIGDYVQIVNYVKNKQPLDLEIRKKFEDFYGINGSGTSRDWRNRYFSFLNECINNGIIPEFKDVLAKIQDKDKKCYASFASKLIATLDPDKPIIDKYVRIAFGFRRNT